MALYQSQNLNGRIRSVGQFLLKVALLLFLSCITAVSFLVIRSHDPVYVLRELKDWTDAKGVKDLRPDQILIPEMNLEIGTWYLKKAVQRWNYQDNAVPFALAEYNAGKSRVDRWIRTALRKKNGQPVTAETFQDSIDFPSTARYVTAILGRYDFYKRRGPLLAGS